MDYIDKAIERFKERTKPSTPRSVVMRIIRKAPKGENRAYKKKGPFANTRLTRAQFIAESQKQGNEIAAKRRGAQLERRRLVDVAG